jgi:hypothetical protein
MEYFCRLLQFIGAALEPADDGGDGLTFLMTWNLDLYEERFDGAIVLLVGDERYQTPSYATRVRAVFKTGGTRRNPLRETLRLPWSIAWRCMLRELRNTLLAMRRGATRVRQYPIPLGVFNLHDVPFVPIDQRTTDVFFAGTTPKYGRVVLRPSVAARLQLGEALRSAETALPDWRIEHTLTRTSAPSFKPAEYSQRMMNAKIIPCPRGNFDETFRLLEAAKCGCVIVTEPLPDRWYYRDAPVITVRGWSELPRVLLELKRDPQRMRSLSERTRRWWDSALSERAVADYMIRELGLSPAAAAAAGAPKAADVVKVE